MTAATGALILDGVAALLNLTIRLVEARESAAAGMARADEGALQANAELDASAAALRIALDRARGLLGDSP